MKADCHLHVYDPRFAPAFPGRRLEARAAASDYRAVQSRIGTQRAVVVQPAAYGTDNSVTLDAIAALGRDRTRGIAVLHPEASREELARLDAGGIRGLRFSIHDPATAAVSADMIAPLAARVAPLGWHVQLHLRAEQILAHAELIRTLPCPIVFDHMARLPLPEGIDHPAYAFVGALLDAGRAWVKLSGPYLESRDGAPGHADAAAVAKAFAARALSRCVWGSDWPHPTEREGKPDDAALRALLDDWVPDARAREAVLVSNPATLYGF